MTPLQRLLVLGLLAACAVPAAPARAAFFTGDTLDGPTADIVRVGGVDLARDGTGTIVYLKRTGGVEHAYAVRMVDGAWQAPERLDTGLPLPSSEPVIAVANRGAAVAAFLNNGRVYTVLRRAGAAGWAAPLPVTEGGAATPSIDLSVNGVGHLVWTRDGDVRAAFLSRSATQFAPLAEPLDIDPAREAGTALGRPRVAASADGTALVAWGEEGRVYARRLLRDALSAYPQELGVAALEGHPGGVADTPEVDIADDSSFAWVTFRQSFDDGAASRVLARRLVGSLFDAPADIGPGGFGGESATAPAVDVAGSGDAMFAGETALSHTPFAALSHIDILRAPFPLSGANTVNSAPALAVGETSQAVAAWFDTDAGPPRVAARSFKYGKPEGAETQLMDFALGAVDPGSGLDAAADRYGDAVVTFIQGVGPDRRLTAAVWDRPPVNLIQSTSYRWRRPLPLRWARISEPWGPITWTVYVDGRRLGTTTKHRFPIAGRVGQGTHRWRLVATDRRGQRRSAGPRSLRIDASGPALRMAIVGSRSAGATLRFVLRARDGLSGLRTTKVDFGDGATAYGRVVGHRFARGTHKVTATAIDKAGNRTTVTRRVTIR